MTWSAISKLIGVAAALFGAWLLYRVMGRYDAAEILGALDKLSFVDFALAGLFTTASFVALAAGEYCAVRYCDHRVGIGRIARTSTAAIGIGHAVGLAALSSGAIRYRMYGRAGVKLESLGRIMLFAGLTVATGMASVGGVAMTVQPHAIAQLLGMDVGHVRLIGAGLLAVVAAYVGLCALHLRALRIGRFTLPLPSPGLALGQIASGAVNYVAIAACLYACLRPFAEADYPTVATLYVGSDAAALIGHVPGGWGVLEYVLTSALEQPHLIAGILVFRTIYYLVPLFVGLGVFLHDEMAGLRQRAAQRKEEPPPPATAAQFPR